MTRRLPALAAAVLVSCGGESAPSHSPKPKPPAAGACAAGTLTQDDGTCWPAGLPADAPCPPAQSKREDGTCVPAGVPPDACAAGFESDGEGGCEPLLPDGPCTAGKMAVPGETACRDVAPCGQAPWGDIPVDAETQYVDAAYVGGASDGTAANPWTTIADAFAAATPGAVIAVAAGTYTEDVAILQKPVRLWGRCPSLVELVGVGAELATVGIVAADGAELHGLAITGPKGGIGVSAALDTKIDRVWVHDTGGRGLEESMALGAASVSLSDSLFEDTVEVGLYVSATEATVTRTVVRETKSNASGKFGRGMSLQSSQASGRAGTAVVSGSVFEGNRAVGLFTVDSNLTLEGSVVRDNVPDVSGGGRGLTVQSEKGATTLTLSGSLVDGNAEAGLYLAGVDATIENTVIRRTQLNASGEYGRGIEFDPRGSTPGKLTLRASILRDNHEIGLLVGSSPAIVEDTVVRDTAPTAAGVFGIGIRVHAFDALLPPSLVLRRSMLVGNHEYAIDADAGTTEIDSSLIGETLPTDKGVYGVGVLVLGGAELQMRGSIVEKAHDLGLLVQFSTATVESSIFRDIQPNYAGSFGRAVQAQGTSDGPANLTLRASRIERALEAGLVVVDSAATVEDCVISDTRAHPADGLYGDGIVVQALAPGAASLAVTRTRIEQSARAAISSFGGAVTLGSSEFVCQLFDLDGEAWEESASTWVDDGNNRCGCPNADRECVQLSSQLAPPTPVDAPSLP